MVDLVLLQSVSYIAGALGVCVAAVNYTLTLRANAKTRKIEYSTGIAERLGAKEKLKDFLELESLKWE